MKALEESEFNFENFENSENSEIFENESKSLKIDFGNSGDFLGQKDQKIKKEYFRYNSYVKKYLDKKFQKKNSKKKVEKEIIFYSNIDKVLLKKNENFSEKSLKNFQ